MGDSHIPIVGLRYKRKVLNRSSMKFPVENTDGYAVGKLLKGRERLYKHLKNLIDDNNNKEHECREFLPHVRDLLFRETLIEYGRSDEEYRGHTGDSDYIVSGKVRDECGVKCVRVYVWELKAPQCHIFQQDIENRVKPTKELIDAENKLLNFYDELRGSNLFLDEFKITHPDNICLGGIIIGCESRLIKGDYDDAKKKELFTRAKRIRDKYLYHDIRLMTWDNILAQLRPIAPTSYYPIPTPRHRIY